MQCGHDCNAQRSSAVHLVSRTCMADLCLTSAVGTPLHHRGLKPLRGQRWPGWAGGLTSLMEETLEIQERCGTLETAKLGLSQQIYTYNRNTFCLKDVHVQCLCAKFEIKKDQ